MCYSGALFEKRFQTFVGTLSERCGPSFLHRAKDCEAIAGKDVKLEFTFFGTPEPHVQWFKDGGPLEENDRVVCTLGEGVATLTITKTEPEDEGWYRCRIFNPCGVGSSECEVLVVEAPKFVKGLEDLKVDEGKKMVICTVN